MTRCQKRALVRNHRMTECMSRV